MRRYGADSLLRLILELEQSFQRLPDDLCAVVP